MLSVWLPLTVLYSGRFFMQQIAIGNRAGLVELHVQGTGRAVFAAGLCLALAGLGHIFIGQWRGIWFAVPSALLLYIHFAGLWEFADVAFLMLGIFSAFDAFSFAQRGYGII